jgi:DNA repair exonuclease SbcCD ATPase subunit
MLKFKNVKWKNFLSTGDKFTEVSLTRSPSTLIVGQNGAGKSTMLDALSFGLFGKPHRNINKPQLINSINGKGCEVQVEFEVGGVNFNIVRGIKPNKFEIWQNDIMINQDSNSRDYQKFLEQNVLKLNHKSFHQIVVLGSSSFIPFMQLSTNHRREVIEDLLDIQVFTKMNGLLRERSSKIKEDMVNVNHQLDKIKEKMELQRKHIKSIESINAEQITSKQNTAREKMDTITALQAANNSLSTFIDTHMTETSAKMKKLTEKKTKLNNFSFQITENIKKVVADAKFYTEHDTCPTCTQEIGEEIKTTKITEAKARAVELKKGQTELNTTMDQVTADILDLESFQTQIFDSQSTINSNNSQIRLLQSIIDQLSKEVTALSDKSGDMSEAVQELEELTTNKDLLNDEKLNLVDLRTYHEVISEMLKDTGIKTKVIKQYLPVMNKLINHYLQVLDFFVSFNLNENFEETIRSRHRDDFTYSSFSEGEKQRIDLALLFTWRQIAKMKNSASTNLLVLDETFDSSLDNDGVDNLMKILNTLDEGTNVFIISHKGEILEGKFRSKIEFVKDRNFSVMKLT